MKLLRYTLLVAALAGGPAFAQQGTVVRTPAFALAGQAVITPAHAAAERALRTFLGSFHDGQALPPGFPLALHRLADLKQVKLGWGFAVNDVQPSSVRAHLGLEAGAQPIGQWRYAIMLRDQPVGLLTMEYTPGGWQLASIGGASLSADINALVTRYGAAPGARLRYVRVPQATADFIEVKQGVAPVRYAPLHAARASLHLTAAASENLLDPADLEPRLREAVARNVAVMH